MEIRIGENTRIENPRKYSALAVDGLRQLLVSGSRAEIDPRREHFYQLEDERSAYYIHVSPFTGAVTLLARWTRRPSECYAGTRTLFTKEVRLPSLT